ncbi:MAG TPA: molybdopterin molybdenumtransferase MoeA, partial [Casimicrobium sp.]|nr:molybdopterin molybdenumtransferase MoeA [Casimicrobium sp.]
MTATIRELSCADDYDPNSMPVDKARDFISKVLSPITLTERLNIRAALGRVTSEDVISPIDVPGHDNSAMDGWAYRHADIGSGTTTPMKRIGTSFAGKPYLGPVGKGECVR